MLVCRTSKYTILSFYRVRYLKNYSSPKHLDEIKEAGLEMPVVNQIEVCYIFLGHYNRENLTKKTTKASPVLSAERHCRLQ